MATINGEPQPTPVKGESDIEYNNRLMSWSGRNQYPSPPFQDIGSANVRPPIAWDSKEERRKWFERNGIGYLANVELPRKPDKSITPYRDCDAGLFDGLMRIVLSFIKRLKWLCSIRLDFNGWSWMDVVIPYYNDPAEHKPKEKANGEQMLTYDELFEGYEECPHAPEPQPTLSSRR